MVKQKDIPTYIGTYPLKGNCKMNYAIKKYRGVNPRFTETSSIFSATWLRISPNDANYCVGRIELKFSAN